MQSHALKQRGLHMRTSYTQSVIPLIARSRLHAMPAWERVRSIGQTPQELTIKWHTIWFVTNFKDTGDSLKWLVR
jgi:hypothetical protein